LACLLWGCAPAACSLAAAPTTALADRPSEKPAEKNVDGQIAALIEQLGHPEYVVRERAQRALATLGFAAFDALTEAENHEDIEIASQAKYLVRMIRVDWTREDDPQHIKEILKDYELQAPHLRKVRMEQLAQLPDGGALACLCRIVRFEPSQKLSKQAALAVIKQTVPTEEGAWQKRATIIQTALDRSTRPGSKWLRAYVLSRTDPQDALDEWVSLAGAEQRMLTEHESSSDPQFVGELLRRQVEMLSRLHRQEQALAVMRKMAAALPAQSQSISEFVEWLVEQKAWSVVDDVATRFSKSFEGDAVLLYTLAQARLAQGDKERAAAAVERALKLNAGKAFEHLQLAENLQKRGLMQWSDEEYRAVLDASPLNAPESLRARLLFSESLHDRAIDDRAGDVLKPLVEAIDRNDALGQIVQRMLQRERTPGAMRSRMNFFYAAHQAQKGDRAKQLELLETAIKQDPTDVDVLIALYHFPGASDERRKNTQELIKKTVDECRYAIQEVPEDPDPYNQLAWLVANTEGDRDEAIVLSQKSIDLLRAAGLLYKAGGYYDTLARCFYVKGDYTNALKYQLEAARLEPHSQQIGRQLEIFKKATAENSPPKTSAVPD